MIKIQKTLCIMALVSAVSIFAMETNDAKVRVLVEDALKRATIPAELTQERINKVRESAVGSATFFAIISDDPKEYDDLVKSALRHEKEGPLKNWCPTGTPAQTQQDDTDSK